MYYKVEIIFQMNQNIRIPEFNISEFGHVRIAHYYYSMYLNDIYLCN